MIKYIVIWCIFNTYNLQKEIDCNNYREFKNRQMAIDFYDTIRYNVNDSDSCFNFCVQLDSVKVK